MADAQEPPKSGKMKWVLGGCCGCSVLALALFFAMGGMAIFAAFKLTEPAVNETKSFLAKTTAGDASGAYASFHSALKKELDEPKFKEMVAGHPELFKVRDTTFSNRSLNNGLVTLDGTLVNEKGETDTCHFQLMEEGGAWKLTAFRITPAGGAPPANPPENPPPANPPGEQPK